jgi:hypothetical protein
MADTTQNQLVADIARDVVAQMAPQELPFFPARSEAYFQNPHKMRPDQTGKDETLGFGVDGATIALMTPIIMSIVDEVVKVICEDVIPDEINQSGIMNKMFKMFRSAKKGNKKVTLPLALTPEQLKQVHNKAISSALELNLSKVQADLLATSLVGKLELANK